MNELHLGYILAIVFAVIWIVLSIVERFQRKKAAERLKEVEQLRTINEYDE